MNFVSYLNREMEKRNWTQSEFAEKANLSRQAISYLLSGKSKKPDSDTIKKIAKAFDVPYSEVLDATGVYPKEAEKDELLRRIEHKLSQIESDDDKRVVEGLIDLLNSRKKTLTRRQSSER